MSEIETGGPAFPDKKPVYRAGYRTGEFEPVPGMTLRDYFAAKAVNAAVTKFIHNTKADGCELLSVDWDHIAESCYDFADAMLKAREAK